MTKAANAPFAHADRHSERYCDHESENDAQARFCPRLDSQAGAAFDATALEDTAATFGVHPAAKAVDAHFAA